MGDGAAAAHRPVALTLTAIAAVLRPPVVNISPFLFSSLGCVVARHACFLRHRHGMLHVGGIAALCVRPALAQLTLTSPPSPCSVQLVVAQLIHLINTLLVQVQVHYLSINTRTLAE